LLLEIFDYLIKGYLIKMKASLFTLGTAQLGMEYGLTNRVGKPDINQAFKLIDEAILQKILSFDTAAGYGNSEAILGKYFYQNPGIKPNIITKLKPLTLDMNTSHEEAIKQVDDSLNLSLERLKIDSINTLMFHRFENLIWSNCFLLNYLKKHSYVKKIGVSVDFPEDAISAIKQDGISAVQLPTNLLDFRYINKGVFDLAEKKGKQIYIRSIYLQGLILMEIDEIPYYLKEAKQLIKNYKRFCTEHGISSLKELTFSLLKKYLTGTNQIVIGCETIDQLKENVKIIRKAKILEKNLKSQIFEEHINLPDHILSPFLWRK